MNSLENLRLSNLFKQYFEIVPAISEELKDEVFRIRHLVYCDDLKFEASRLDERESDEYDSYSLHLLIRSIPTGKFIGCTRLIYPGLKEGFPPLPIEKTCIGKLDKSIIDIGKLSRHKIAEVSRLAVLPNYRRRKSDSKTAISLSSKDYSSEEHPRFPYIPIGLYLGTAELARLYEIDTLFVLTEKRLALHFNRLGFGLRFIGNSIEHHGKRIPSMMSVDTIINDMRPLLRPLYHAIAMDIKKYLPTDQKINK